jgi:predicted DNA-binding transcriptional regulator AlpA
MSAAQSVEPLLITAPEAAALCSVSPRTWRRWFALGYVPAPVRVGRTLLWSRSDLVAWVANKCPRIKARSP